MAPDQIAAANRTAFVRLGVAALLVEGYSHERAQSVLFWRAVDEQYGLTPLAIDVARTPARQGGRTS